MILRERAVAAQWRSHRRVIGAIELTVIREKFRWAASLSLANIDDIPGFVLTSVLTRPFFSVLSCEFTYEKRRGRESNPRIAVLQTATLPLGYPAILRKRKVSGA
jgi:hypothetical protein